MQISLLVNSISKCKLFGSYEYMFRNFENYIDPDNNFYNDTYVNCRYNNDKE